MIIALSLRLWSTIKAMAQEGPTSAPCIGLLRRAKDGRVHRRDLARSNSEAVPMPSGRLRPFRVCDSFCTPRPRSVFPNTRRNDATSRARHALAALTQHMPHSANAIWTGRDSNQDLTELARHPTRLVESLSGGGKRLAATSRSNVETENPARVAVSCLLSTGSLPPEAAASASAEDWRAVVASGEDICCPDIGVEPSRSSMTTRKRGVWTFSYFVSAMT